MTTVVDFEEQSTFVKQAIDEGRIGGTQILVILIAIVLNMLDGFDVTAMAFTVHQIGEQFQIAPSMLGIVFSVALAGMMIGAMFVAPIADVIGRRKMILVCTAIVGVTTFLTGYADSLWVLIVLRLLTGIAVGGLLASLAAMAAEFSPEKYRSLAVVCVTAGYPLGATAGGFIAAILIPQYGWQSVFFAGGSLTLLMVVLIYFLLPESLQFLISRRPDNALAKVNKLLYRLKKSPLDELPAVNTASSIEKATVLSLLSTSRRGKTLTLWACFFLCFICLYFLMSWIPKLVVNTGLSETEGVYASVAFTGGGVLGIVMLGWMAARFGLSRLIGGSLLAAALFMMIFATASGVQNLLIYLMLIGFLMQAGFAGLYAVAAKIYPTELRATGVGWAIGIGRFGAVVGPYVGGVLIDMDVSMESNFIIFALPLLASGLLVYKLSVR